MARASRTGQPKVWQVWVDGRNTRGEVDQWVESITATKEAARARAHRINTQIEKFPNQVAWVEYDEAAEVTYSWTNRQKLTNADVDEILDLVGRGVKQAVIADQFNVHVSAISKIKNGQRRKAPDAKSNYNPNPACKVTDEQVREIKALRAQGNTLKTIAGQFGISTSTVSAICTGKSRAA